MMKVLTACILGGIGGMFVAFLSAELILFLTSLVTAPTNYDYVHHLTKGNPMSYAGFMVRVFAAFAALVGGTIGGGFGYHVGFSWWDRERIERVTLGAVAGSIPAAGLGLFIAGAYISGSYLYDAPPGMVVWFTLAVGAAAGMAAFASGALAARSGALASGDARESSRAEKT